MAKISTSNNQISAGPQTASSFSPGDLMRCVEGEYVGSLALRIYPDTFVVFGTNPVVVRSTDRTTYATTKFVLAKGETVTISE